MSAFSSWQAGYERRVIAREAGQREAEQAEVSGLIAGKEDVPITVSYSEWPMSGDALALSKARVIS